MKNINHYSALAEMFRYPSEKFKDLIPVWNKIISQYNPELIQKFKVFPSHLTEKSLASQQEYYISTFDVLPLCTLDVGYVLFGEDFRRGEFLVNIKKEHVKAGIDCGTELPDHLPDILYLLPRMADTDLTEELVCSLLIPAVNEMIYKFRDISNIYKELLEILLKILETDFPETRFERFNPREQGIEHMNIGIYPE